MSGRGGGELCCGWQGGAGEEGGRGCTRTYTCAVCVWGGVCFVCVRACMCVCVCVLIGRPHTEKNAPIPGLMRVARTETTDKLSHTLAVCLSASASLSRAPCFRGTAIFSFQIGPFVKGDLSQPPQVQNQILVTWGGI